MEEEGRRGRKKEEEARVSSPIHFWVEPVRSQSRLIPPPRLEKETQMPHFQVNLDGIRKFKSNKGIHQFQNKGSGNGSSVSQGNESSKNEEGGEGDRAEEVGAAEGHGADRRRELTPWSPVEAAPFSGAACLLTGKGGRLWLGFLARWDSKGERRRAHERGTRGKKAQSAARHESQGRGATRWWRVAALFFIL